MSVRQYIRYNPPGQKGSVPVAPVMGELAAFGPRKLFTNLARIFTAYSSRMRIPARKENDHSQWKDCPDGSSSAALTSRETAGVKRHHPDRIFVLGPRSSRVDQTSLNDSFLLGFSDNHTHAEQLGQLNF